jgi:predicted membrane channel-forming protein YqfA (hemolysin III family)|tara:strand:- start:946 stop:1236 length:291 start_codon:yes stop_codon:yes gene_type:complete
MRDIWQAKAAIWSEVLNKKKKKKKVPACRRCIIIRYFILASALIIACIPLADERFEPLQSLTVWHFVFIILGIGIVGFIFKFIFETPKRQDHDGKP